MKRPEKSYFLDDRDLNKLDSLLDNFEMDLMEAEIDYNYSDFENLIELIPPLRKAIAKQDQKNKQANK